MVSRTTLPVLEEQLTEYLRAQPSGTMRIVGSREEYWQLVTETNYRLDYYAGEIITSMSYESEDHLTIAEKLLPLKAIYRGVL